MKRFSATLKGVVGLSHTPAVREAQAAEALAAGALHILTLMVCHRFPLLPMSDYSARALVRAAEIGMTFNAEDDAGFHNEDGLYFRTRNGMGAKKGGGRQRSNRGQARRAGETLMLELLLAQSRDEGPKRSCSQR